MNVTIYRMPDRGDARLFRIPKWTALLLAYLSFCLMGVFAMRSSLMRYAITTPELFFGAARGDSAVVHWSVYLLSGVLDAVWFELLLHVFVNLLRGRFPHADGANTRHAIRVFFIFRNLTLAALYLVPYWHPIAVGMILNVATFLVTTAYCAGFCFYFASRHLPRFLAGHGLAVMSQYYFGYHVLIVLLYLFMGIAI